MRAIAPVTIDAILAGSDDAGSLIERMCDASDGSVFDACSTSFIARSISRGEPSKRSEFDSLSTATVTPASSDWVASSLGGTCVGSFAETGGTCANASVRNASRAGMSGGHTGTPPTGSVISLLLCEFAAGFLGAS